MKTDSKAGIRMHSSVWNMLRRTVLGVVAALAAVVLTLGWGFAQSQWDGVLVFIVALNVFAAPFLIVAELSLRRKPRSYFVLAATYAQAYIGVLIGFKYIFSYSLLRQFSYNASAVYAAFFLCFLGGVIVDELISRYIGRRRQWSGAGRAAKLKIVQLIAGSAGPATVIAVAAVLLVFIQRTNPVIPKVRFDFLQTGAFYADISSEYTVAPLSSSLLIPDAMQVVALPNDADRFCVASLGGQVFFVERKGEEFEQRVMLDLRPTIGSLEGENGLQGAAFGPRIENVGDHKVIKLLVFYAFRSGEKNINRLSAFDVDYDRMIVDPSEEQILIEQVDPDSMHNGGGVAFGSDGYLYLALGDGGPVNDGSNTSQVITEDLFSGILRIDVYGSDPTAVKPIERQPRSGRTAGYFIPKDNPFVGKEDVLEEFWALGFRNPFRIHPSRISGAMWVGDVGQAYYEEANLVHAGGNGQWSYREGPFEYSLSRFAGNKPSSYVGVETPPVFSYPRQEGRGCVIGGTVYGGSLFPELNGFYLFGDHLSGEVFGMEDRAGEPTEIKRLLNTRERGSWRARGMTSITEVGGQILVTLLGNGDSGNTLLIMQRTNPRDELVHDSSGVRHASVGEQFRLHCSRCHGEHGVPTSEWAIPQFRAPRDLTDSAWQATVTDSDMERVIRFGGATLEQGPSAMPPWEGVLSPEEIKAMVGLIRGFAK